MLPDFSQAIPLLQFAFVTAALASAQSVALADSMRDREPGHVSPNREFMAQGVANILGGLFQALPASASLSRTAVNISAGAKTRMANLLAGVFIAIGVLLFGNQLELIPLAALAGHLIVAAISLIDRTALKLVWQVSTPARVTLLVTLGSTLLLPLEWSLILGVGTRLVFYLRETSRDPQVIQLEMNGTYFVERPLPSKLISRQPVIVSLRETLNFASVKSLDDFLPDPHDVEAPCVILRLRNQPTLGSTGIRLLLRYHAQIQRQGGHLLLSGVLPTLQKELEKSGALQIIGPKNVFYADDRLFHATEQALYRAQAWLVGL
jgi:SulP family sulfate permease